MEEAFAHKVSTADPLAGGGGVGCSARDRVPRRDESHHNKHGHQLSRADDRPHSNTAHRQHARHRSGHRCAYGCNSCVTSLIVHRALSRTLSGPSSPAGLFTPLIAQTLPQLTAARDETFNSITGLNGSGKSNILDAICFVLGITNMSTVRAQNLQVRCAVLTLCKP